MADELDAAGTAWEHPRAGKRVAIWEQPVQVPGVQRPVRRVLRLVERTIGTRGQHLILPEAELQGRLGDNAALEPGRRQDHHAAR